MWYIKDENINEVNDAKNFNEAIEAINRLVSEGKGFTIPFHHGKTNMALEMHFKAIKDGYTFVHYDIG